MIKTKYLLVSAAIMIISLSGCAADPIGVRAGLGEVFTLGVGESAQITGEDMTVRFDEVTGDSRCPQNVTCIWEGVASSNITINYKDSDYSITLNQPGFSEQAQETFMDYLFTYSLNPYPREGEQISPEEYLLTLTITK